MKASASRENGKKGGRPRKLKPADIARMFDVPLSKLALGGRPKKEKQDA